MDQGFDHARGTDTARDQPIPLSRRVTRTGWDAIRYATVREDKIRVLLEPWPRTTTLLDLGCGKGRTLIVAAEMGFHACGIELLPGLAQIARANLRHLGLTAQVTTGNALDAPWPEGALVAYLYNPFRGRVMEAVSARLTARRDETVAIYVNPYCPNAFAGWTAIPLTPAQAALFSPGSVALWRHSGVTATHTDTPPHPAHFS